MIVKNDNPTNDNPRLLNYRRAAQYLSLSERKLWALAASAEIPVCRIGRSVRFDRADLDLFIDRLKKRRP